MLRRGKLERNARRLRSGLTEQVFEVIDGAHPITPVMIGDAATATAMADDLLQRGVYAIGFSYPVVPKDQARIRLQPSAAHSDADVDLVIDAFVAARDATMR